MGEGRAENVYVTLEGTHSVSCLQMVGTGRDRGDDCTFPHTTCLSPSLYI